MIPPSDLNLLILALVYILLQAVPLSGATIIITRGEIFVPFRTWLGTHAEWAPIGSRKERWLTRLTYFSKCPLCVGAWAGIGGHILVALVLAFPAVPDLGWLLLGGLASGCATALLREAIPRPGGPTPKPTPKAE